MAVLARGLAMAVKDVSVLQGSEEPSHDAGQTMPPEESVCQREYRYHRAMGMRELAAAIWSFAGRSISQHELGEPKGQCFQRQQWNTLHISDYLLLC
ncbi:hypothetical protein SKAU_G00349250 [Synaphobranchus kaupii]|uniref:Uncharacterized protein n=1 Tax=Synaphobranchus kaupii TaxID=118154 RepID=A0A9Q1IHS6_SYNKA|nr:hypothetical protein SKAU_G00349250 [Synaphobranchus kaupii]